VQAILERVPSEAAFEHVRDQIRAGVRLKLSAHYLEMVGVGALSAEEALSLSRAKWRWLHRGQEAVGACFRSIGRSVHATVGFEEILMFAAAALVGCGLAQIWWPGATIVPGVFFAYIVLFGVKR